MPEPFERLREQLAQAPPPPTFRLRPRSVVFLVSVLVVAFFGSLHVARTWAEPEVIPIGQEKIVDPFAYSVQSVSSRVTIGSGVLSRRAEGVYKEVALTVRNTDSEPHAVSEEKMSIVDAAGNEYLPVCREDIGSCVDFPQAFTQRFLAPDEEILGVFIFDVPAEATGFKLRVISDAFSGTSVLFDLD